MLSVVRKALFFVLLFSIVAVVMATPKKIIERNKTSFHLFDEMRFADTSIINIYTPVRALDDCSNNLIVADATGFKVGDTILIIQMKGAIVDSSNTTTFGSINQLRNAGNFEFNFVKNIDGNRIELLNGLIRNYDFDDGFVQLIRVPYFENLVTNTVLSALPWDGEKGGVLAFNVGNQLTLNENIDVTGRGFRGGLDPYSNPVPLYCYENNFYYPPNPDLASQKGEGIATISAAKSFGKGSLANGGGGGNSHNSGGGGGANAGNGGFGGYNYDQSPCHTIVPFDNRGVGGRFLLYSNSDRRLFLGGGGGGGQTNNTGRFEAWGGSGGGVVIFSAARLVSNGNKIVANGNDARPCVNTNVNCHEGMGGGGAGGVIAAIVNNYADLAHMEVVGGKGGDMVATGLGRLGSGGGGGGGVVWISNPALPGNLAADVRGGDRGINTGYNDAFGATAGETGTIITTLELPRSTTPYQPNIRSVAFQNNALSCTEVSFHGAAVTTTRPIALWEWDFGDGSTGGTQNITHNYSSAGTYTVKLIVTDETGCKDSTSLPVTTGLNAFNFTYTRDICNPFTVSFTGTGLADNPYWDLGDGTILTGSTSVTHTFAEGDYEVKYIVGNDPACYDTLRSIISLRLLLEDIILTPDTTICAESAKLLRAVPATQYCWSPAGSLDNPFIQYPTATPTNPTKYYLLAEIPGDNLIVNGDFSQGNVAFHSDYQFNASGLPEGVYFVGNNVQAWHGGMAACADHTGANGNMMMINGSATANEVVWSQTVTVQPYTNYVFSAWLQSLLPQNPARLQFTINGRVMGTGLLASATSCDWQRFFAHWNPGSVTTATIAIINQNTNTTGNDFALDDILFAPILFKMDSVEIGINHPQVNATQPPTICVATPVQLSASGASTYSWNNAQFLNDANISNPIATVTDTTVFIVTGINAAGCEAKDTIVVNTFAVPQLAIQQDTSICRSGSVQLWVQGGNSYLWSPATTLDNPNIATPIASPNGNTEYFVDITDVNNCVFRDSVLISIRPDADFRASGGNRICIGDTMQLQASGGDVYAWTPAVDIDDPESASPNVWPATSTQYSVSIIDTTCFQSATLVVPVNVSPVPTIVASRSNDIDCTVNESVLSASGAVQYLWSPAQTLDNVNVRNPRARPRVTTTYVVTGTNADGCTGGDSVTVKVEKVNEGNYLMPNAFTPNGDGLNDCFGIKYWGIVEQIEFSVFNRWGERIFYSKDPDGCWDGTFQGRKQDSGVFIYMIRAKTSCAEEVFRKGTFVLVR